MVEQARRLSPEIEFRQGDMLSLDAGDGSWAGIAVFYSIIHVPREELPRVLRVLQAGGLLLFHVGEETVHVEEWWGQEVSIDFVFFRPEEMEGFLVTAGFDVEEVIYRSPYGEDVEVQTRRAYVCAVHT